ncbi:hypothetical protein F5Y15DRAFT_171777 [Xylariaceae sp. FL0016]|nr:hypothetical protein F5Y15DRAFT_171777 [Xylariaceae sp. FL0016]
MATSGPRNSSTSSPLLSMLSKDRVLLSMRTFLYRKRRRKANVALALSSFLICLAILALSIALMVRDGQRWPPVVLWNAPIAAFVAIWDAAEILYVCSKSSRRGFEPGAHVILDLVWCIAAGGCAILTAVVLRLATWTIEDCRELEGMVVRRLHKVAHHEYCDQAAYKKVTAGHEVGMLTAAVALLVALRLLHLLLFLFACIDIALNSDTHYPEHSHRSNQYSRSAESKPQTGVGASFQAPRTGRASRNFETRDSRQPQPYNHLGDYYA